MRNIIGKAKSIDNRRRWALLAVLAASTFVYSCSNPEKDFQTASQANSEQAYQGFIAKHPRSPLVADAKLKIEKLAFESAKHIHKPEAYEDFLKRFAASSLAKQAESDLQNLEYDIAKQAGTVTAFEAFLSRFGSSDLAEKARADLARIESSRRFQYVQTGYPVYKLAGEIASNAVMISETILSEERIIAPDAQVSRVELNADDLGGKLPLRRIKWEEHYGDGFAITVRGATEAKCGLMFQDIAYLKIGDRKYPLMVLGYKGCPISFKEITPMSDIAIREPVVIDIASIDESRLRASEESAVPFIVTEQATMPCFMAVNVQWRFPMAGMSFSTNNQTYKTTKPGATITFTETGVKFEGVDEVSKAKK